MYQRFLLWLNQTPLCGWTTLGPSTPLWDVWAALPLRAGVNHTVHTCAEAPVWTCFTLYWVPTWNPGSHGSSASVLWRRRRDCLSRGRVVPIPTSRAQASTTTSSPTRVIFWGWFVLFLDPGLPSACEVISHCGFSLHFLNE